MGWATSDGTDDSADRIATSPTGVSSSSGFQEFDDDNSTTARTLVNQWGELEFCLQMDDGGGVSGGDSVTFQLVYSGDTVFSSYDTTPTLTAESAGESGSVAADTGITTASVDTSLNHPGSVAADTSIVERR